MKFLEVVRQILLSLIIAILLPVILNSGINLIFEQPKYDDYVKKQINYERNEPHQEDVELKKQQEQYKQALQPYNKIVFFSSILVGLITIIIGAFIKINALSVGLIGGGILDIFMGLFNKPNIPLLNFIILVMLLIILIIIIIKGQSKNNYLTENK